MSGVRDLFFDEFFEELGKVIDGAVENIQPDEPPILESSVKKVWNQYSSKDEEREDPLISVDGGVQYSHFAYGDFVAVGRACSLTHWPGRERSMEKKVRLYLGKVFSQRDRSFIPSYVRQISEYQVAAAAAERVIDEGGSPIVLLDGALYFSSFPYAMREYTHHPKLLADLFSSVARLRSMSREHDFPLIGISKDSTVFYLYMEVLKEAVRKAGLSRLAALIGEADSPMDLRYRYERWDLQDRGEMDRFFEERLLCDTSLINEVTRSEGYTLPLLLAPSIYHRRGDDVPSLLKRITDNLSSRKAEELSDAFKRLFNAPSIAVFYWKPGSRHRPFRIDILASSLGHSEPCRDVRDNRFVGAYTDLREVERVLNHLGYWFCNDVEYNIPLKQADTLARFDRRLYRSKYEPFIIDMLERAGMRIRGRRRIQREVY
ncbi:MAG: DNA double-strand break repair nuclease NurA [Candidatus Bathyarchaeia archaeon]